MGIDITQVIIALIGVLATVLTGYTIPWLKLKAGEERWDQLVEFAGVAVMAAEKLKVNEKGSDKLKYATNQVIAMLEAHNISYDIDTIRAAIESAVYFTKQKQ